MTTPQTETARWLTNIAQAATEAAELALRGVDDIGTGEWTPATPANQLLTLKLHDIQEWLMRAVANADRYEHGLDEPSDETVERLQLMTSSMVELIRRAAR